LLIAIGTRWKWKTQTENRKRDKGAAEAALGLIEVSLPRDDLLAKVQLHREKRSTNETDSMAKRIDIYYSLSIYEPFIL